MMKRKNLKITATMFVSVILLIGIVSSLNVRVNAQEEVPFFTIHALLPGWTPDRALMGSIICSNLEKLNIQIIQHPLSWEETAPRTYAIKPEMAGSTWVEGGYDIYFDDWSYPSIVPDPRIYFHSSQWTPAGRNTYWFNYTENDNLLDEYSNTWNATEALEILYDWEEAYMTWQPEIAIMYTTRTVAANPSVTGLDVAAYHAWRSTIWEVYSCPWHWAWPDVEDGDFTIAQAQDPEGFMPGISLKWGNEYSIIIPYDALVGINNWDEQEIIPLLATDWTWSTDGKTLTVNLRQDAKWHDGVMFNASDVVFTWDFLSSEAVGSTEQGAFAQYNMTYEATGPYQVTVHLPKPSATFVDTILSVPIIPYHFFKIMNIPMEEIKTSPFQTLTSYDLDLSAYGLPTYHGSGPIGTGPFRFVSYSPSTRTYQYERFDDWWQDAERPANSFKTLTLVVITDTEAAIAALKNGEVDLLYTGYFIESKAGEIDPSWGKIYSVSMNERRRMHVNCQHPIIGTGVETPLGQTDAARAFEAACYIRQAFSHAIPRQLIVDQIFGGFGDPAGINVVPGKYLNPTITVPQYNLTIAKQLMEKAGYSYPEELSDIDARLTVLESTVSQLTNLVYVAIPISVVGIVLSVAVYYYTRQKE